MNRILCIMFISTIVLFMSCCKRSDSSSSNITSNIGNTTTNTNPTSSDVVSSSIESTTIPKPYIDGKKLVVFGDSITALGTWGKDAAEELNVYFYNAAMGGITSAQGIDRFNAVVKNSEADFVTICFGQNDLIMNTYNTPKVSLEDFRSNMTRLVEMTKEINATPILLTTNPLNPDLFWSAQGQKKENYTEVGGDPLAWLDEYNKVTREVAESTNTDLVDMRSKFSEKYYRNTLSDGIHLNARGNEIFKNALLEYFYSIYSNDPNAEKISNEDLNIYVEGNDEYSIISLNPNDWYTVDSSTIKGVIEENGSMSLYNTNGKWPDMQYSIPNPIVINYEKGLLYYEITIQNVDSSIILFFNGSTPSAYTNDEYVSINKLITDNYNSVGDIIGPVTLSGSIKLTDLNIPKNKLVDGNLILSGVKVFVAGSANQKVTISKLSVGLSNE